MEISEIIKYKYSQVELAEIKNLIKMQRQNKQILNKMEKMDKLYNLTINRINDQILKNIDDITSLNNRFAENKKHFNYIIKQLKY